MVNKVILLGNVGKDVETKTFDDGNSTAQFTLATNERYKDRDGNAQERVTWHNIVTWGKLADIVTKYVKKGDKLYLEGKITQRSWDKQDGTKGYITEIVCHEMKMLGSKSEGGGQNAPAPTEAPAKNTQTETDDLPF